MPDPRLQKLARVLVQYSLALKPGDRFLISSHEVGIPLAREVYREAIRAGAHVDIDVSVEELSEILLREGSEEQLTYVSDLDRLHVEHYTVMLEVWASENTRALSGVDPARMAMRRAARVELFKRGLERLAKGESRWCGTLYPTNAHAQDAGMSLSDYEDFVYKAGRLDLDDPVAAWKQVHKEQQRVVDFLERHDEIHIVAPGTDITYRAAGRKWINCAGTENFPDGEVFTGPIEDSVKTSPSGKFSVPAQLIHLRPAAR